MKRAPGPITVERGDVRERIIFTGSRKPMSRRDLHVALEPILRRGLQIGGRAGNYARLVDMKRPGSPPSPKRSLTSSIAASSTGARVPSAPGSRTTAGSEMRRLHAGGRREDLRGLGFIVEEPADDTDDQATAVIAPTPADAP